jgi:uncharacterized linocin/CFP29 family protein
MTEWLRRGASPLSEKVWNAIDEAAIAMMKQTVVARRIADFDGPHGWGHVAMQLGTFKPVRSSSKAAASRVRLSVPDVILLTEIRVDFTLPWQTIDTYERMGPILEADEIEDAAREMALAEDRFVFFGTAAGSPGLLTSPQSPSVALSDWSVSGRVVTDLLMAVQKLDEIGVKGPYAAVLSPAHYYSYLRNTAEGYPAAKQVGMVIEHVYSSPVIEGAALFSTRGGDAVITVGGDFSVGYRWHDEAAVHLFCVETIAVQLLTPKAVCLIKPA